MADAEKDEPTLEEALKANRKGRGRRRDPVSSATTPPMNQPTRSLEVGSSETPPAAASPAITSPVPAVATAPKPLPLPLYMASLGRRYGFILDARPVYEGDDFSYAHGLQEILVHVPKTDQTSITYVWATATYPSGYKIFEVIQPADYVAHLTKEEGVVAQLCKIAIRKLLERVPEVPNA